MSTALSSPPADTAELEAFQASLAEYSIWNGRGQGPLTEDRGQKVRIALIGAFREISPSAAELTSEITSRRFAIRRRKTRAGRTLTVNEEIKARLRSRRFLAASFVMPGWKRLGEDEGQSGRFTARTRAQKMIGSALVRTATGNPAPSVDLTSILTGAVVQSRRRQLTAGVLRAQAADMAVYVARKHREWMASRLIGDFRTTISA